MTIHQAGAFDWGTRMQRCAVCGFVLKRPYSDDNTLIERMDGTLVPAVIRPPRGFPAGALIELHAYGYAIALDAKQPTCGKD